MNFVTSTQVTLGNLRAGTLDKPDSNEKWSIQFRLTPSAYQRTKNISIEKNLTMFCACLQCANISINLSFLTISILWMIM